MPLRTCSLTRPASFDLLTDPSSYAVPSMNVGLLGTSYPGTWSSGPMYAQHQMTSASAETGLPSAGDIWTRAEYSGNIGGCNSAHSRRHLRQNSDPSMLLSSLARASMDEAPEHPNSPDAQRVTAATSEVTGHSKTFYGNSPQGGVLIPCNHNHDFARHQQCRLDALCLGQPPASSSYRQQHGIHKCGVAERSKGSQAAESPGRGTFQNVATETATLLMSRSGDENYIEYD